MGIEYPAGRAPGFDLSHPLAAGIRFSGVASGGSFIPLHAGGHVSSSGTPVAVQTAAGPGTSYTSGASSYYADGRTNTPTAITAAAILTPLSSAPWQAFVDTGNNNNNGMAFYWSVVGVASSDNSISTLSLSTMNVPYFVAISADSVSAKVNIVVTNLATGSITSQTITLNGVIWPNASPMYIGYSKFDTKSANAILHTLAVSESATSMAALRAVAADPWAFWLPEPAGAYAIRSAQWVPVNLHPHLASAVSAASSSRAAPSARIASAATMEAQARAAGAPYVKIAGHGRGSVTGSATGSPIVAVSAASRSAASSSGRGAPSVIVHLAAAARGMASASGRAAAAVRVALASLSAASATGRASASVRVAAAARAMISAMGRARPRFPPVIDPRAYLVAPRTIRALVARITTRTLRVKK